MYISSVNIVLKLLAGIWEPDQLQHQYNKSNGAWNSSGQIIWHVI